MNHSSDLASLQSFEEARLNRAAAAWPDIHTTNDFLPRKPSDAPIEHVARHGSHLVRSSSTRIFSSRVLVDQLSCENLPSARQQRGRGLAAVFDSSMRRMKARKRYD